METWTDVIGYEGIYAVSDTGLIKRIKSGRGSKVHRILKPFITKHGYAQVSLSTNCKEIKFYIHRLVFSSFNKTEINGTINHINGVKLDNRLSNLEDISLSDNVKHSHHVLGNHTHGENNGNSILTVDDILKIRDMGKTMKAADIAPLFNVHRTTIHDVLVKRKWKSV